MSSQQKQQGKISRRGFLKGAAASATMVTGASALGYTSALAASPAPAQAVPETWDQETDVVVVGASGSGLAAAIEAADAGAKVLIVEKADHVGGLWIGAGGHAIIGETDVQARLGIEDHKQWWMEDELRENDHRSQPEILQAYVDMGPDTIKWMEDLGITWADTLIENPGHRVPRGHWPGPSENYTGGYPSYAGHAWIFMMKKKVDEQGTSVLLQHRLTRIYRSPDGPVVGIEVDNEGATVNIKANKGVVLACGGFTDNQALVSAFDPRIDTDTYGDGRYVENSGDGLLAAMEIGGTYTDTGFVSFLPIKFGSKAYWVWDSPDWLNAPQSGIGAGLTMSADAWQRGIIVKNDGKRYINEAEGGRAENAERPDQPFTAAYLNLPDRPRNVWYITDTNGLEALKLPPTLFDNPDADKAPGIYPDMVAMGQTLTELAEKIGVPAENLIDTVGRYNEFAKEGVDEEFDKPAPLYALIKGPFYAAKAGMIRHTQDGGLRINSKAQVLDISGLKNVAGGSVDAQPVIPHLYAAGEVTAFLGWRHTHGKLGNCATFGRIAGKNAAAETASV